MFSVVQHSNANRLDILTVNDRPGQYPQSYYAATANPPAPSDPAQGSITCDVCVIGGGFTGLSSALHLAEKGYDVVLVEAHRVGWGASGRNGGQVGTGQRLDQTALEKQVGKQHAKELWDLARQSQLMVKDLIDKHHIQCDYTPGIVHADHRARYVKPHHEYVQKLNNDYNYELITPLDKDQVSQETSSESYYGGSLDLGAAHVHPLNYCLGLAKAARAAGVRIFEQSRVLSLKESEPATITTESATVTAKFVVLGCNGYHGTLQKNIASHVMPINNFIIATEPLHSTDVKSLIPNNYAVADSRFVVNYYRKSADNRLLFGGGENYSYRFPKDITALVKKPMFKIYPQLKEVKIDYAWGGTLGITMNRMPHFDRVRGNILSAAGYSGHGVAMATLSGALMADAIDGQAGAFDIMDRVPKQRFPGGSMLRSPLLVLGMTWYALRDHL